MGMNLGGFGGYYPMSFNSNRPMQLGQMSSNNGPNQARHEYGSVDDLINDLNDGKFKKDDTVVLKRDNYTETYTVLRNGRLKRC